MFDLSLKMPEKRRCDTQHNDIEDNNSQPNILK